MGHIPVAQITIQAPSFIEHLPHVSDFGDIPSTQVFIEPGRIVIVNIPSFIDLRKHRPHVSDFRDIPHADVENATCPREHVAHVGDVRHILMWSFMGGPQLIRPATFMESEDTSL